MNKVGIGLWLVLLTVLVLDIGINCVKAQGGSAGVVKAQEVQIVDSRGNTLIDLHGNKTGEPVIALKDAQGVLRAGMIVTDSGSHLQLCDTSGRTSLVAGGMDDPYLIMYKGDKEQAFLGVRDGWPTLSLDDPAGNDRAAMTYDPDKDLSLLELSGKDSKQSAEMALTDDYAIVDVSDKAGTRRAALKCTSDGVSQLYVADENGDPSWSQSNPEN